MRQRLKTGVILGGRPVFTLGIGGAGVYAADDDLADNSLTLLGFARVRLAAGLCHAPQSKPIVAALRVRPLKAPAAIVTAPTVRPTY